MTAGVIFMPLLDNYSKWVAYQRGGKIVEREMDYYQIGVAFLGRYLIVLKDEYNSEFRLLQCPKDQDFIAPPEDVSASFPYNANYHYWSYCYNSRMARSYPALTCQA